jgi:hypothetical protein
MANVVALKQIIKAVESIQAEHRVTQKKLMAFRKALNLLDPETTIRLKPAKVGKGTAYGWPNGKQCLLR